MPALRGILFDYSGTVLIANEIDIECGLKEVCSQFPLESSAESDEIVRFALELEGSFQEIRNQTVFEFSFDKFLRIVIDYFCIHTDKSLSELESIYYEAAVSYDAAPHIRQFVEGARAVGIRTGIVSNSTHAGALLKRQIDKAGISDLFDFLISSADYGIRKQNGLLYDIALKKLGMQRNEVVFIGDSLEYDIATAQAAGLTGVWYNAKKKEAGDVIPDYTFESWKDVKYSMFEPKA